MNSFEVGQGPKTAKNGPLLRLYSCPKFGRVDIDDLPLSDLGDTPPESSEVNSAINTGNS